MEITRRNFLTGAAAMGGLVAFGLAGCAPKSVQADADEALAETGGETSATATEGAEVTPEPTPDATVDADVVVIGGGASGLCAAISAVQNGAKVVLFEKQAQLGGNGMMPEGLFAVNSPKQAELGIESPRKIDIIANEFQFNNFRITYDYWSNYIDGSGESIAWLLDLGVVIERVESMFGSPEVFHYGEGGHCEQMIETLIAATDTLGVDVHLNAPAIRLKQEDGAVVGAYAEGPEGVILANAKAVILTSGGFSGDTEKVRELVGYDTTYMQTPPNPANVGDGMRMAFEMGAASAPAACLTASRSVGDVRGTDLFVVSAGQPFLWLNELGHRYIWEDLGTQSMTLVVRANMAQKKAFSIFDSEEFDRLCNEGAPLKRYRTLAHTPLMNLADEIEQALETPEIEGAKLAYRADTIEELAEQMGIDAEEAVKAVERYNELCEKGIDEDFGKAAEYLIPVKTPPFYGFRETLECQTSLGGIDIDPFNRVVDAAGAVIPGLWAGGSDASKLTMESYNIEVPGSLLGYCVYSGRTMGKAAAEYAKA